MNKILLILLFISSSCIKQTPQKLIDFKNTSDFNESKFQIVQKDTKLNSITTKLYSKYCLSCHGHNAIGSVGPNLTDETWLNGSGSIRDIYKIIRYGITNKGMRAFENTLSDEQLMAMSIYIDSLKIANTEI